MHIWTNRISGYCRWLFEINILQTLYFNFKVFPWPVAKKLPVYFFGSVKFPSLNGKVILHSEYITSGMVQFGCKQENIIATREPTRISIDGELVLKGGNKFAHAVQLLVWNNGKLAYGFNTWMGSFSKVVAFRSVDIGNNFLASWECQIFDTDFHFIEQTDTNTIADPNGTVVVGEQVWLGSRSTILKNTIIPNDCIIAAGSICNKDYTGTCPPGSVLGGAPAKFIKPGVKYVNDRQLEKKLFNHFQQPQNFGTVINKTQF